VQENKNSIIVIGYSGHSYVLIETLIRLGFPIFGYTEKKNKINNPFDLKYLGNEKDPEFSFFNKNFQYAVGIGDNNLRTSIGDFLRSKSCKLVNTVHPDTSISKNISLGTGIFIARNVSINSFTSIENDVIVNTSATIDHECFIGRGSHIAPGSVLLGNVKIGKNSFIGANAVVKEGVVIGNNVIIGAGSVVLKNVENNKIIYGNPAK
jgi:sugar O-acyltransferase (sialic acid O-acetyltransferase NeuD family)